AGQRLQIDTRSRGNLFSRIARTYGLPFMDPKLMHFFGKTDKNAAKGKHSMKRFVAATLLAIAILAIFGPSGIASGQTPSGRIVLRPGKLLDVKDGSLKSNQAIVIEGDKISSVGPVSAVKASTNDRVIDLPNATVLPGLIDAHTHLTFNPQFGYESLAISVPREALIGARNARVTLNAGFTAVRNVGAQGYADVALRDAIN